MSTPSRSKNKPYSAREYKAMLMVHTFLKEVKHDIICQGLPNNKINYEKKYSDPTRLTSMLFDTSVITVRRASQKNAEFEYNENEPPEKKLRKQNTPIICDSFTIAEIRRVTLDLYSQRVYPTCEMILDACLKNPHFPRIQETLFRSWLKKAKFKYRPMNRKPVYLERKDIVVQRETYLRLIRKYRCEGYEIVYVDETWASPEQAPNRCWLIFLENEEFRQFRDVGSNNKILIDMNGYAGGWKVNGGAGRVIINHAGSSSGFIDGVADIFISKKDTKDYHQAMNGEHYLNWFTLLLEKVQHHSVIVLDQAPYHRIRVPDSVMPKLYWKKGDIIANLVLRKIPLPLDVEDFTKLTKRSLLHLSEEHPVSVKYEVEKLAEACGKDVKILWLPVAHCEFNPIELVWSYVKTKIGKNNCKGGTKNVLEVAKDVCAGVTQQLWAACVNHAIKIEDAMWARDNLVEKNFIEHIQKPIIINPFLDDSDSSAFADTEEEDEEMLAENGLEELICTIIVVFYFYLYFLSMVHINSSTHVIFVLD